jgi:hypothetical protein
MYVENDRPANWEEEKTNDRGVHTESRKRGVASSHRNGSSEINV